MKERWELKRIRGVIPAMLTPFDGSEEVDIPAVKALAEHLEISTAAVATTLKKLEADGYILRRADPADSRFNKIVLTDSGVRLVDTTRQFFDEVDRAMFVGFSEAERAALQGFVERMAQNMRNYEHGKEDCK